MVKANGPKHALDGTTDPLGDYSLDWSGLASPPNFNAPGISPNSLQTASATANLGPAFQLGGASSVQIGDLGVIIGQSGGPGGGTGVTSGASTTAPSPTLVTTSGSGLAIDLIWDTSVGSAPASFVSDIIAAAKFLESQISTTTTINLNVGYGTIAGTPLSRGALGESSTYLVSVNYASLVAALKATASTDATDAAMLASLPAVSPVTGTYWVTTAEAKALGLSAANGTALDGYIGFATSSSFTYGDTNTSGSVASGTYDFFATAAHEITETMGRLLLVGETIGKGPGYSLMDLTHFSGPGVRDFTQSTAGYFSVDGGVTNLGAFNTVPGGDPGDWASSVSNNSFDAYATPGVLETVSANDLTLLDAIGWNLTGASSGPPSGVAPTGISLAVTGSALASLEATTGLNPNVAFGTIAEVGGTTGDSFSYSLGGTDAASFSLNATSGALSTGTVALSGNHVYALTFTATDTTAKLSSSAIPFDVVVGTNGGDTINIASLISSTTTSAMVFGLGGNDVLNGSGMTSHLWFVGGAGADKMTGGSGGNTYLYGSASESIPSAFDTITNFNTNADVIDLTGLGAGVLKTLSSIPGATQSIAAHSVDYLYNSGSNTTFVYMNTSNSSESLSKANMEIALVGHVALTTSDFHVA